MQEFTIERPNVTYEITVDGCVYELDSRFIFSGGGSGTGGDADTLNNQSSSFYLNRVNHTGSQAIATVTGLNTALVNLSDADSTLAGEIVAINNTLPLKADLVGGVIPTSQIPAIAITEFLKLPNNELPVSEVEMLTLRGQQGDFTIRTDLSTQFTIVSGNGSLLSDWLAMPQASSPVTSVNGQIGNIILGRGDIGIDSSDNVPEGVSNLYYTDQRVRNTALTGLSLAITTPITAVDSVLSAAGKLQAQVNAIAPAPRRMPVGYWQTATGLVAAVNATLSGASANYVYFYLPNTITISQVSVVTAAAVAGAELKLRFYDHITRSAISPEYVIPAAASGLIVYTLPPPLTLPAGGCFFGIATSTGASRQVSGVNSASPIAFPSTNGLLPPFFTQPIVYASGLPELATLVGAATGAQPNVNFFVSA